MISEDLIRYLSQAPSGEALVFVVTIETAFNTVNLDQIKDIVISWAKDEGLKVNSLPSFPHIILQTNTEHWQDVLAASDSPLMREDISMEINRDVSYLPDS